METIEVDANSIQDATKSKYTMVSGPYKGDGICHYKDLAGPYKQRTRTYRSSQGPTRIYKDLRGPSKALRTFVSA